MDQDGTLTISFDEWRDFLLLAPTTDIHDLIKFWRHSTVSWSILGVQCCSGQKSREVLRSRMGIRASWGLVQSRAFSAHWRYQLMSSLVVVDMDFVTIYSNQLLCTTFVYIYKWVQSDAVCLLISGDALVVVMMIMGCVGATVINDVSKSRLLLQQPFGDCLVSPQLLVNWYYSQYSSYSWLICSIRWMLTRTVQK